MGARIPPGAALSVSLGDLLGRIAVQLERTAEAISRVDVSLGILVAQTKSLSPTLIRDLQEIDLAYQSTFDIARVVRLAAEQGDGCRIDATEVEAAIRVRSLAEQFLRPNPVAKPGLPSEDGTVLWL